MRLPQTALTVAILASATSHAEAVNLGLHPNGMVGESFPGVDVDIEDQIAGFELKLSRNDGKTFDFKGGGKPGVTRKIDLNQPEGTFHYEGELIVLFPNGGSASTPVEFDTTMWGRLKVKLDRKNVDLSRRSFAFTLSRAIQKAQVRVEMDTGLSVLDREIPFHGEDAGTLLEVSWPEGRGHVMNISVQAYDTAGFYTGVEMSPWQVEIPHEEVQFDTAKWEIRISEMAKLDKSYQQIVTAVREYGPGKALKLYIAGHTDTVGSSDSNRLLSLNRARAIAQDFRKRGVKMPIFYEGFGEEALKVATDDETPEEKNRRAEYILALEDPTVHAPFPPQWHRL